MKRIITVLIAVILSACIPANQKPEKVISEYPINSHIIRLYDYPENVVDIIKRK